LRCVDDPGLVFFLGQGLLEESGARGRPAWALGDDLDPGPGCSRRARPADRSRRPEGDLMELNGWASPQMLRRYGASARARRTYDRIMTDT
jgi:hypothetical protein